VKETNNLIEEFILEHRQTNEATSNLQQTINDLTGWKEMEAAREDFGPGRLQNQRQKLQKLEESLGLLDRGLKAHFFREETLLLKAFESHGGQELASALNELLLEHNELRRRLDSILGAAAELLSGRLSESLWPSKAWDLRAYMSKTAESLAVHAQKEEALFDKARRELSREPEAG